jgi:hypothetical protein
MQAHPQLDRRFRQEWSEGQAEDVFKVVSRHSRIRVPYGSFRHALRTEETNALEPDVLDNKYYAKGIGEVAELSVKGPRGGAQAGRDHLLTWTGLARAPRPCALAVRTAGAEFIPTGGGPGPTRWEDSPEGPFGSVADDGRRTARGRVRTMGVDEHPEHEHHPEGAEAPTSGRCTRLSSGAVRPAPR